MNLCRVLGPVVATEKLAAFSAKKLLMVQPVDEHLRAQGKPYIAVDDAMSAGEGDVVLVMNEGSGARQVLKDSTAPIRSLVMGVVDRVDVSR